MRESGLWRICRVWESWWPQGVSGPWRSPAPNTTPSNPPPSFHTRVRKIFPKCAPKIPWKCFHFLLEIPTPISTHILPSPFLSLPTYTSAQIIHPEYSHLTGRDRVTKTPSARQQCWPESFCKSGKFLWQVHYWLKNFRILCNTKYPDNMQSVRMNWKVSGQSKKCPDNLENVSG